MLCLLFSEMSPPVWTSCPSTSNAVEGKNSKCKEKNPLPLKAMFTGLYVVSTFLHQKKNLPYSTKVRQMKLRPLMHNVARKNVMQSHQLVILKLWGNLQIKKSNFNGEMMKVLFLDNLTW